MHAHHQIPHMSRLPSLSPSTPHIQYCLEEGYHPLALLCILPKLGKRCRALSNSYRLIALLSCLGKRLERICSNKKVRHLISPLHFGAIARRSAIDTAATLTHMTEKSFQDKKILTALAFDIKRAFD